MRNTWPNGIRKSLTPSQHNKWNYNNYPGTLQICCRCCKPTEKCEEDEITDEYGNTYCVNCAIENEEIGIDND